MLRRGLEEGGDLRACVCLCGEYEVGGVVTVEMVVALCVCVGRGIPQRSAGVHVAEDRLLIQRKYTACSAAVPNPREEDSDTFVIVIRII